MSLEESREKLMTKWNETISSDSQIDIETIPKCLPKSRAYNAIDMNNAKPSAEQFGKTLKKQDANKMVISKIRKALIDAGYASAKVDEVIKDVD